DEDEAVREAIDGDGCKHGREPEVLAAPHEPRAGNGADAEREHGGEKVAGHDGAEEPKDADPFAKRVEQLLPLPRTHELLGHDGERDKGEKAPIGGPK